MNKYNEKENKLYFYVMELGMFDESTKDQRMVNITWTTIMKYNSDSSRT